MSQSSNELSPLGELSEIAIGINAIRCFTFDEIIEILVSMYHEEGNNPSKRALIDWIIIQSINKRPKGITRHQQITLILPLLHPKVKRVCIQILNVMNEDEDINEYI